jgi:hypothetical protein
MDLNSRGLKIVESTQVLLYTEEIVRVYADGRREPQEPRLVFGSSVQVALSGRCYRGENQEQISLIDYTLPDGTVYSEHVQAAPWALSPVLFLALKDQQGNWVSESLWLPEEISQRVGFDFVCSEYERYGP